MKSCKLHTRVCSPRYTVLYIDRKKTFKVCFLATMWKYGKFYGDSMHPYDQWVTVKRKKGKLCLFSAFSKNIFLWCISKKISSCIILLPVHLKFQNRLHKSFIFIETIILNASVQVAISSFKNRSKRYVCEKVTRSEWNFNNQPNFL